MHLETLELLRTADGRAALAAAEGLAPVRDGALSAVTALRAMGIAPDLASAALTQSGLRRAAVPKFGADATSMFFTRAGLEQATRAPVARRRAQRLASHGVRVVADLGCGIGADCLALARAGLRVLAVEADPLTAAVARANVEARGYAGLVEVRCADATAVDLSTVDAVFCDPARRGGAAGTRVFHPSGYSPPWPFVAGLPDRVPATVLKLAPGLDHAHIPAGAEAEWVSVDGDVVEAALWCGPLSTVGRRATLLRAGGVRAAALTGSGERSAATGAVGRWLYNPDGAVVRAHLVAEFAELVGGHLADPRIAYVFSDDAAPVLTPYASCFEVVERLPYALTQLRAALRSRGIGSLEILKRGVAVDPAQLRRRLRLAGDQSASLVLTRLGSTPTALLLLRRS
jgi:SAM-dependent methyltransferase